MSYILTLDDLPALAETGHEIAEHFDIGRQYTIDKSAAHPVDIEVWYTNLGNLFFMTYPGQSMVMWFQGSATQIKGDMKERYKRSYCYISQNQYCQNERYKYENGEWHYVETKKDHAERKRTQ